MTWLRRWWKRYTRGAEAQAAVEQAKQQQAQADNLGSSIARAARKVDQAAHRTDMLAREVTRALGAR